MDIKFSTRSRFIAACENAIRQGRAELENRGTVRVMFEDGGYPGRVTLTIRRDDAVSFGTDWEGADPTRFPARIKAVATALKQCNCYGRYLVMHHEGSVEITPA